LIAEGGYTLADVQTMTLEQVADALDFLQVVRDRQLWQHGQRHG
jgi:hypothetical protein